MPFHTKRKNHFIGIECAACLFFVACVCGKLGCVGWQIQSRCVGIASVGGNVFFWRDMAGVFAFAAPVSGSRSQAKMGLAMFIEFVAHDMADFLFRKRIDVFECPALFPQNDCACVAMGLCVVGQCVSVAGNWDAHTPAFLSATISLCRKMVVGFGKFIAVYVAFVWDYFAVQAA